LHPHFYEICLSISWQSQFLCLLFVFSFLKGRNPNDWGTSLYSHQILFGSLFSTSRNLFVPLHCCPPPPLVQRSLGVVLFTRVCCLFSRLLLFAPTSGLVFHFFPPLLILGILVSLYSQPPFFYCFPPFSQQNLLSSVPIVVGFRLPPHGLRPDVSLAQKVSLFSVPTFAQDTRIDGVLIPLLTPPRNTVPRVCKFRH